MIPDFFFGSRYPMIRRPCAKLQDRRGVSHFFSVRYDHHFGLRNYAPIRPVVWRVANCTTAETYTIL